MFKYTCAAKAHAPYLSNYIYTYLTTGYIQYSILCFLYNHAGFCYIITNEEADIQINSMPSLSLD